MNNAPDLYKSTMQIADNIDRLITIDITGRGVVGLLYQAARAVQEAPLTWLAAKGLYERVKPGDVVVIATGMPVGPLQFGEQDGPVGAATLARSLVLGLGANLELMALIVQNGADLGGLYRRDKWPWLDRG